MKGLKSIATLTALLLGLSGAGCAASAPQTSRGLDYCKLEEGLHKTPDGKIISVGRVPMPQDGGAYQMRLDRATLEAKAQFAEVAQKAGYGSNLTLTGSRKIYQGTCGKEVIAVVEYGNSNVPREVFEEATSKSN